MFRNYLRTATRIFLRNKVFTGINIIGLSIGISASIVIFLIVSFDLSFDNFHKDGNRIYRVVSSLGVMGQQYPGAGVTNHLADAVAKEITGADIVAPLYTWDRYPKVTSSTPGVANPLVLKKQTNIVFVDENYFKLFSYTWLTGSPGISLAKPYQVVLTESGARLYFPNLPYAQVAGQQLTFNDTIHTIVTGIVKDIEQNTDFTFTTFISRPTLKTAVFRGGEDMWNANQPASQLFIKLSPGVTAAQFTPKLIKLYNSHYKPAADDNSTITYGLQPLRDLHFNEDYGNYFNNHLAHKPSLIGLLAVAAFLLLLACINFITLTTAQASRRAKETGIRKAMGGSKKQLVLQFLHETFLLTFVAALLSVVICPFVLKLFADFIPAGVHFNIIKQPGILLFLVALIAVVSFLSGYYPALVLSSYKPALMLKNNAFGNDGTTRAGWLRKTLTVTQFVIAQVFIIAVLLVTKQINYVVNNNLGFKKDAILYFNTYFSRDTNRTALLLQKLKAIPQVAMVSLSSNPASTNSDWTSTMKYKNGNKEIETEVEIKLADTNYINLYQLKLLAGTNLPQSDTANSLIINTTYLHALGFSQPQQALGKLIHWNSRQLPVTGVVADFHQKSMHEVINPLIISNWTKNAQVFNVALQPQDAEGTVWKTALARMEKAFKEVYPAEDAFTYSFVDDTIAKYYETEKNLSRLLAWATALAVLISCLGMLGLVIFVTNQRAKEIGIRKVLGATVTGIITLISKDFLKLVGLAFVITLPIAWWGANKWLENFAYKTTLNWWLFAAGGATMLIIAFMVMFFKTFSAAIANPVEVLKNE